MELNFTTLLQAGIAICFLTLGSAKLAGARALREAFERLGLPVWLRRLVGVVEIVGALAMLASVAQPFLAFFAAVLLAAVCLGALVTHWLRKPRQGWPFAAALLSACVLVAGLQPLGLRVLALPNAAELPQQVWQSERVAQFSVGDMLEGVVLDAQGNQYLSINHGLNLLTGDKRNVVGKVIKRSPLGTQSIFFELPKGNLAGTMVFDGEHNGYLTAFGPQGGVWKLSDGGQGKLLAPAKADAWPNGIAMGPDGALYVADSAQGLVLRIDPATGQTSEALGDARLAPRKFIALAPGANGIRFRGNEMLVTVSDRALILSAQRRVDGSYGEVRVVASGIPGDDFSVSASGDLFVTTHPYNTVVKIDRSGKAAVIATAAEGVTGATAAALTTTVDGNVALYVVTDGGALSPEPSGLPSLLKLTPPSKN